MNGVVQLGLAGKALALLAGFHYLLYAPDTCFYSTPLEIAGDDFPKESANFLLWQPAAYKLHNRHALLENGMRRALGAQQAQGDSQEAACRGSFAQVFFLAAGAEALHREEVGAGVLALHVLKHNLFAL